MIKFVKNLPKNSLQLLISGLRPFLGPATCRYPAGCTKFALEQLETQSLPYALIAITKIAAMTIINIVQIVFIEKPCLS